MSNALKVGIRVVRGVDWEWSDQDGGEGHVGTITDIGGQGSSKMPAGTVVVVWDNGLKANYRAGYQCKDDLRVLDNGPAGVQHRGVVCDECRTSDIAGIRWKCTICDDYDLCSNCYMSGKHDIKHAFDRRETPFSQSARVSRRFQSERKQAKGIFVGAEVTRGPDWIYQNQDGGDGNKGTVTSVNHSNDGTSSRSWIAVKWNVSGTSNGYRRGHEGMLDVQFVKAANGELYYVEHLPKLEEYDNNVFNIGDYVQLKTEELSPSENAQMMQKGVRNAVGRVRKCDDNERRVSVEFGSGSDKKTFGIPASYLSKSRRVQVGDTVKIINDSDEMKKLQIGHGGFNPLMLSIVGETAKVISIDSDGDVKVNVGGRKWILNPQCCTLESRGQQQLGSNNTNKQDDSDADNDDDNDSSDSGDATQGALFVLSMLMGMQLSDSSADPQILLAAAAQGHASNVRQILSRHPDLVNRKVTDNSVTALQAASHKGHIEVVNILLNVGARPDIVDADRDTAFHYAALGDEPASLELMLKKTTNGMDNINKNGHTPLHSAVIKQHAKCVRVLLKYNCDVNTQDGAGDTPLHDAFSKDSKEIVDMLLATKKIQFNLQNGKGFNTLQHAAIKGHHHGLRKMLPMAPHLVNVAKSDGFTPLHIAAINGYVECVKALIEVGKANMEATNSRFHTPLLVAVLNGQAPMIELLTEKGANLKAEDSDGDTALHNVLIMMMRNAKQATSLMTVMMNAILQSQTQIKSIERAPKIFQVYKQLSDDPNPVHGWLAVACYLVSSGADLEHKNRANKTPLDLIPQANIRELLKKFKPKLTPVRRPVASAVVSKCMMCTTEPIGVTFRPCGHSVACVECSSRMKQCFSCHERIQEKLLTSSPAAPASARPATSRGDREVACRQQ